MNRRVGLFIASIGAVAAMVLPGVISAPPRLIWNASASVPVGLYSVSPNTVLHVGDIVVVTPPEPLSASLAARGSMPKGVPLLKPIAALPGQTVCRHGLRINIDGAFVGMALANDRTDRPLPVWQGCRTLGPREVFLMNPAEHDSFDGRYFGVLPLCSVIGRATPHWLPKEY
jgi:conjugative transfer signal peptidase TraF